MILNPGVMLQVCLNSIVFMFFLKVHKNRASQASLGSAFHTRGAMTEKALCLFTTNQA